MKQKALAAAIASLLPCATLHAADYTVSDLGALPGARYSLGLGVNDSGEVTGFAPGADHVLYSGFLGVDKLLPQAIDAALGGSYSQGSDINNFHQVTGLGYVQGDASYHAFVWQTGGAARDLGTLESSTAIGNSQGISINDKGQVAGMSSVRAGTAHHAALWSPANGIWTAEDLGTLAADGSGDSRANSINSNGLVAGFATVPGSRNLRPVVWSKATGKWSIKDLGTLNGNFGLAAGINDSGVVVGASSTLNDATIHAFLADSTVATPSLTDLKTLGGAYSEARAINASGEVVGYSTSPGDLQHLAFVWRDVTTGMQDLNTLIDPALGWQLQEANAISDAGYITGVGLLNGQKHAFLLTKIGDKTPPVVGAALNPLAPSSSGWYLVAPSLTWSVSDAESAISASTGCANIAAIGDTVGQTFTCTATSGGGTSTQSVTVKVDTTPPALAASATVTGLLNGASTMAVTYALPTVTEAGSGVSAAGVACTPASGGSFGLGTTPVSCTVSDVAGNTSSSRFDVLVKDPSAPSIAPVITGTIGNNGWYRSAVTLAWKVTDLESPATNNGCLGLNLATDTTAAGVTDTCGASSAGGLAATQSQTIKIDTKAPVVGAVANITAEALGASGAPVSWTAPQATDGLSGPATQLASCSPASGSTFSLGATHPVTCSATDAAGNTGSVSFNVAVTDTTAPVLTVPANIVTTTPSTLGAVVNFVASANDTVSGATAVTCTPASGSTFATGTTTTVGCASTDAAGNIANKSFTVSVALSTTGGTGGNTGGGGTGTPTDTVAPVLTGPASLTLTATSASGAVANFTVLSDDGSLVTCTPASGTTFVIGTTNVACSATDAAGNTGRYSFPVTVNAPAPTAAPDLSTSIAVSTTTPRMGDRVTYTFVVRNAGNADAAGVVFTDVLPSALKFDKVSTTAGTCSNVSGTVRCNLGARAAGSSATVTVAVKPSVIGSFNNSASASTTTAEPVTSNNVSPVVTITAR